MGTKSLGKPNELQERSIVEAAVNNRYRSELGFVAKKSSEHGKENWWLLPHKVPLLN